MLIHLDKDDVILICEQAAESFEQEDEGELYTEEVIKRFEEADIETIEARTGSSADEFFMEIFQAWDGVDSNDILDLMTEALSNIDIDLTYDEVEEDDDDDSFEDDDEDEDDDFEDDEEEYEESFDD